VAILQDLEGVKRELKVMINATKYRKVLLWANKAADKVFQQVKMSQVRKLRRLLDEARRSKAPRRKPPQNNVNVTNLSSRSLDGHEQYLDPLPWFELHTP
jgi:hypothetical protein